ncbi:hypothetical protein SAMN04487785_104192 [Dyella jiangningensis]|uniref:hypothetical protein n=1 Tax=Dyella sp. AtDHG13 TaxID=1938897 RepID=UPI000891E2BB|nr:hypothetical protein [Dyella sp. AtDHG13]PXV61454.1 hypothetical protein BDW41_101191 [Dyella sp. AtDHG13]SDJ89301.1 hypothetical protein SAMN04487785_104192 [Dyella jiangningensis]
MKPFLVTAFVAGLMFIGSASAQNASHAARIAASPTDTPSPQLVCQVYPFPNAPGLSCSGPVPSGTYQAVFNFLNLPAGSYTYSWNIPSQPRIYGLVGCTTGANCTVQFRANGDDFNETVTATAYNTTTGQQFVLTAYITQLATCNGGGTIGYHWC